MVDRYGSVAELCYFGTEAVETRNLALLPGLHSSFLSGLLRRADADLSGSPGGFPGGDLVAFLREEWAESLYDDSFAAFAAGLRAALEGDASLDALWASLQGVLAGADADPDVMAVIDVACAETVAGGVGTGGTALPVETRRIVEQQVQRFIEARR